MLPSTRIARLAAMLCLCTSAVALAAPPPAPATPIHLYAAGSLRTPLTTIAQAYSSRTGIPVKLTFGSSGLLRRHIEQGARADVFASADMGQPRRLARAGGWHAPVVFARNRLCILSPTALAITPDTVLATLLKPDVSIGTSTPHADPSGDYTWQLFRKAETVHPGAYATLDAKAQKLVGGAHSPKLTSPPGKNALAWLMARHHLDVFVSYCSSAQGIVRQAPQLKLTELPTKLQVNVTEGITWRNGASTAARGLVAAIRSDAGRKTFEAAGFMTPPKP